MKKKPAVKPQAVKKARYTETDKPPKIDRVIGSNSEHVVVLDITGRAWVINISGAIAVKVKAYTA